MQTTTLARVDDVGVSDGDGARRQADDVQRDVVAFLGERDCPVYRVGASAGRPRESGSGPHVIDTHTARVFVGERIVCKIKRAIAYGYLDMTALETRRRLCERELELNRPTLPDIYIDVVPITREANGTLAPAGGGEVVEWVLRMHRFEQHLVLDEIAGAHRLSHSLARRLGGSIARYHAPLPRDPVGDGHARLSEVVDELDAELAPLDDRLPAERRVRFVGRARRALERWRALLDRRAAGGFVRRCHGDLHLRNLLLHEGVPVPFDALEFDERLATTDVLYDLAFLIMDLGHRGLPEQQNLVLNEYLLHSEPDNAEGLALLPLFLATRAAVRAMTTAQTPARDAAHAGVLAREAAGYLRGAAAYLRRRRPLLIAVGGLSGSGKSTVAAALPTRVAGEPGAILLGSDAERKAALGIEPDQRLDSSRYTTSAAEENYRGLREKAAHALRGGFTVVLDATWLDGEERTAVRALASAVGVPFVGLWLDAPPTTLRRRVALRRADVSDATVAVLDAQIARGGRAPDDWHGIDASGEPLDTLRRALLPIERAADGGERTD